MKVTHHSAEILVVEDRPVLTAIALWLFVLIFVAVGLSALSTSLFAALMFIGVGGGLGLVALWAFVRRVQLVFHRPEGWIERREKTLTGQRAARYPLDRLERARVAGRGNLFRVELDFRPGQAPRVLALSEAWSSHGNHARVAEAINAWLSGETA